MNATDTQRGDHAGSIGSIKDRVSRILRDNILPFWLEYSRDTDNGGFFGEIDNQNRVDRKAGKGLVMTARFLWTFSALYNAHPGGDQAEKYAAMADHAWEFLCSALYDREHGGFYWNCDYRGRPIHRFKQIYGQAFALYGMSEYLAGREHAEMAGIAAETFALMEARSRDREFGGYWEACSETWEVIEEQALSERDVPCAKGMNTHLHVLEAYSRYLSSGAAGDNTEPLRGALESVIRTIGERIVDGETGHFGIYFKRDWQRIDAISSYGHDIEGSWLIIEALEALGDEDLSVSQRPLTMKLFEASLEGMRSMEATEGGPAMRCMINETHGETLDENLIWWVQAEALVGLVNAWQMTGADDLLGLAQEVLRFIETRQCADSGEWYAIVDPGGAAREDVAKAGEWKTPYHNVRCCLEILNRL
jgi:mannobiose 2-epimerase